MEKGVGLHMLNVTDKAASALRESLQASSERDSDVLRLTEADEGLGLVLGEEQEGDQVIEHGDRKILVIGPTIAEALDGVTMDAVETPGGQQLVLKRPEDRDREGALT